MVMDKFRESISISTKPFSPFMILSPKSQVILYFTQTFAHLTGLHPSITPIAISTPIFRNINPDILYYSSMNSYEIHQVKQSTPFSHEDFWVEELIHELRTASLTVDLGAHVLAGSRDQAPILLQKLLRASH
ncbi:MAG: hypothetical protein ACFFDI_19260, partial [Promethearchaeota archaeon]